MFTFLIDELSTAERDQWPLDFSFFNSNKKMIEILRKITIIVVENAESYCFIIIFKCKQVPLSLCYPYFLIKCWLQLLTTDERSSYYQVYVNPALPAYITAIYYNVPLNYINSSPWLIVEPPSQKYFGFSMLLYTWQTKLYIHFFFF